MPTNPSLKGYVPGLARLIGTTPAALYERQRVLMRIDLLETGGQGPGMGVRPTSAAVALLLIAVLASDSLSESETRVGRLAKMKLVSGQPAVGTWNTLLNAMSTILLSDSQAARVKSIEVSRTADRAIIRHVARSTLRECTFEGPHSQEPGITKSATLTSELLRLIGSDVRSMVKERFNEDATPEVSNSTSQRSRNT